WFVVLARQRAKPHNIMAALTAGNKIDIPQAGHVDSSPDWRLSLLKRFGGSQKEPLVQLPSLSPCGTWVLPFLEILGSSGTVCSWITCSASLPGSFWSLVQVT